VVKNIPPNIPLLIKTDSKYLLEDVTKNSQKWEDKGWLEIKNKELIKTITAWIRYRTAPTAFQWIKGHSGEQDNEEADKLVAGSISTSSG
jgi:ribonuclease HI